MKVAVDSASLPPRSRPGPAARIALEQLPRGRRAAARRARAPAPAGRARRVRDAPSIVGAAPPARPAIARDPRRVIGSGAKSGSSPPCSAKRAMHLRGAQPELARQREKEIVGIGQVGVRPGGCRAGGRLDQRVVEIARQVIERLRPAVALIAHKAEQHAERGRVVRPLRRRQLDRRRAAAACWQSRPARPGSAHISISGCGPGCSRR